MNIESDFIITDENFIGESSEWVMVHGHVDRTQFFYKLVQVVFWLIGEDEAQEMLSGGFRAVYDDIQHCYAIKEKEGHAGYDEYWLFQLEPVHPDGLEVFPVTVFGFDSRVTTRYAEPYVPPVVEEEPEPQDGLADRLLWKETHHHGDQKLRTPGLRD